MQCSKKMRRFPSSCSPITIQHPLILLVNAYKCLPLNHSTGLQLFQVRSCLFYAPIASIYPTALDTVGSQYMQILIIMCYELNVSVPHKIYMLPS